MYNHAVDLFGLPNLPCYLVVDTASAETVECRRFESHPGQRCPRFSCIVGSAFAHGCNAFVLR